MPSLSEIFGATAAPKRKMSFGEIFSPPAPVATQVGDFLSQYQDPGVPQPDMMAWMEDPANNPPDPSWMVPRGPTGDGIDPYGQNPNDYMQSQYGATQGRAAKGAIPEVENFLGQYGQEPAQLPGMTPDGESVLQYPISPRNPPTSDPLGADNYAEMYQDIASRQPYAESDEEAYQRNLQLAAEMDQENRGPITGNPVYRLGEDIVNAGASAIVDPLLAAEAKLGIDGASEMLQQRQANQDISHMRDMSWAERTAGGIGESIAQFGTLALAGGGLSSALGLGGKAATAAKWGTIGGGMGQQSYSGAYRDAINSGKTEEEAAKIATATAALEVGVMGAFQAVGLGGAERAIASGLGVNAAKGAASKTTLQGIKNFLKQTAGELTEEEITTLTQNLAQIGGAGSAMDYLNTAVQTIGTMGLLSGSQKFINFIAEPTRAKAKALGLDKVYSDDQLADVASSIASTVYGPSEQGRDLTSLAQPPQTGQDQAGAEFAKQAWSDVDSTAPQPPADALPPNATPQPPVQPEAAQVAPPEPVIQPEPVAPERVASEPPRKRRIGDKATTPPVTTLTGRSIPSPPQLRRDAGERGITNDIRKQLQWLLDEGIAEATARGDDYNLRWMQGEKVGSLSKGNGLPQATVDSLNEYLFGETNPSWDAKTGERIESGVELSSPPPVPAPFTKPLVTPTVDAPVQNKRIGDKVAPVEATPPATPEAKESWQMTREEFADSRKSDPNTKDGDYDRAIWNAYHDDKLSREEVDRLTLRDTQGGKHFWAKTRREVEQEKKDAIKAAKKERADINKQKSTKEFASWRIRSQSNTAKNNITNVEKYHQGLLDVHKERIQEALAEGRPVPPEVLADYPDLAKPSTPPSVAPPDAPPVAPSRAPADSGVAKETGYLNGSQIEYTGVINDDGMREFVYLEGVKKGQTGVRWTEAEKDARSEQNRREWQEQQEGFKRLHEPQPPAPPAQVKAVAPKKTIGTKKSPPAVDKEVADAQSLVDKAMPKAGGKVTRNADGLRVSFPNGKSTALKMVEEVPATEAEVTRGLNNYEIEDTPENRAQFKANIRGRFQLGGKDVHGIIFLRSGLGENASGVMRHELVHFARQTGAWTEAEWNALVAEVAPEAVGKSEKVQEEAVTRAIQNKDVAGRLREFIDAILAAMGVDVAKLNSLAAQARTGEVLAKKQTAPPTTAKAKRQSRPTIDAIPNDIQVEVEAIKRKTGERVKVKQNARDAYVELDEDAKSYKKLLNCLGK